MNGVREVTMQGSTVEEAVRKALDVLSVSLQEVQVVVESRPRSRFFGLWRQPARVRVIEKPNSHKAPADREEKVESNDVSREEEVAQDGSIAVENGQVVVENGVGRGRHPVIRPGSHTRVWVNGELIKDKRVLLPGDEVRVEAVDEEPYSDIRVDIAPDKLSAAIKVVRRPGRRYRVVEQPPKADCTIMAVSESMIPPPPLSMEQISDVLEQAGVVHGIDWGRIRSIVEKLELAGDECEESIPVAFGTPPKPPVDSRLELSFQDSSSGDNGGVHSILGSFHIPTVKAGELIIVKHPAKEGTPGLRVTGEMVPVRRPRDITVRVGKGAALDPTGLQVIATRGGRPRVFRGFVEVVPQFAVRGDLEASAGAIDFDGDVLVTGTVHDGAKIRCGGKVVVGGSVYGGEVKGDEGVVIGKGIVRSQVMAGDRQTFLIQLVSVLQELSRNLGVLVEMAETVKKNKGFRTTDLEKYGDGLLVKLLLERKVPETTHGLETLLRLTQDGHRAVPDDFKAFAKNMYQTLSGLGLSRVQHISEIEAFVQRLQDYISVFERDQGQPADVIADAVHNSEVRATGQITIKGQSCYYARLIAGKGVAMRSGVFRGDLIITHEGDVVLDQVGSSLDKHLTIEIVKNGRFKANLVNRGVTVKIGGRAHQFDRPARDVEIWLQKGDLTVKADGSNRPVAQAHA